MAGEIRDLVHGREADRWGGWSWREPSRGEHYRTCSYCGSIHPEDLAAEDTWRAEWADPKHGWPHKFYVSLPNRHPRQRFIISTSNAAEPPQVFGDDAWIRGCDIPADVNTDGHGDLTGLWVRLGTRPTHHAKFYSVHLADPAITPEAVDRVQRTSGLRFRFHDGHVTWGPAKALEEGEAP